jgi:hypothetical protein
VYTFSITPNINLLKPKLITFKHSVRTAKKTQHFTITKINWLTLFKEIIAVYTENHTKHITTLRGQNELLIVKVGGRLHIVTTGLNGLNGLPMNRSKNTIVVKKLKKKLHLK